MVVHDANNFRNLKRGQMPQTKNQEIQPASDQFVQSLARGLAIIRAFDADNSSLTLSEVASRTGLARAVARRFLLTLETLGYVRSHGRYYELTGLVLELGYSYLASQPLSALATPFLEELSAKTGESTSIATIDGGDIVYIARIHRRSIMQVNVNIGTRFPAAATAMGRVILAAMPTKELDAFLVANPTPKLTSRTITSPVELKKELKRVFENGWALVDQELEIGLRSLAVPIKDDKNNVVAGMNISIQVAPGDSDAEHDKQVEKFLPLLKETANQLIRAATRSGEIN